MITYKEIEDVKVVTPDANEVTLFNSGGTLAFKDESGEVFRLIKQSDLDAIEAVQPYYSNSYVDRLKALGSDVQYSNYLGGAISTSTLIDSRLILTSVYIPKISTISSIGWRQNTVGDYTEDNYNGIGVYSIDLISGGLTLIGKTTNDGTIWKTVAAQGYGNKDLETPVVLEKGIYFLGFLYNSSQVVIAPGLGYASTSFGALSNMAYFNTPANTYLTAYSSDQMSLPTNIPQSSLTFSASVANDVLFWLS